MAKVKTGPGPKADLPAHTPGNKSGNSKGNYEKQVGHYPDGRSSSERSTGVGAKARNPIDPSMPNLSPA